VSADAGVPDDRVPSSNPLGQEIQLTRQANRMLAREADADRLLTAHDARSAGAAGAPSGVPLSDGRQCQRALVRASLLLLPRDDATSRRRTA